MDVQRQRRWRATASTWVEKATELLRWEGREASSAEGRWLVGYEAARLLGDLLGAAESLVPLLNDDQDYEVERLRGEARGVAKALRDRALASKLANTTGRTPAEARAFAAKAAALGGRDDG